jgi:hypothetical protein
MPEGEGHREILAAWILHLESRSVTLSRTSFEEHAGPMDGWAVTGPPAGSGPNSNNFVRSTAAGFPEGAVIATGDTLYMGFGFEGISDTASRNVVMGRAMGYLLR